jgi:hypothetical protein
MYELKDLELKYYKMLFDHFADQAKLSEQEVANILKDGFINLNSIKGDKSLPCLFPNCSSIGVERSHLFSRGFLKLISENGKFYSKSFFPKITKENPHFQIEEIGISQAMTFPGFCSVCEKKFPFERNKEYSEVKDYFLQLFRTVCYDKRVLEIEIESNKQTLKRIIEVSTNKIRPIFNKTGARLEHISGTNLMETFLEKKNKELAKELNKINITYQKFLEAYIEKRSIKIVAMSIPTSIPFFTGYVGNIKLRVGEKIFKSNVVLNIHPVTANETLVFFTDFRRKLNETILKSLSVDDFVGIFAEIMACSNNWVVKKTYWHLLSDQTRFEVLRNRKLKTNADGKVVFVSGHQRD